MASTTTDQEAGGSGSNDGCILLQRFAWIFLHTIFVVENRLLATSFFLAIDWLTVNGEVVIPVSFWTVIRGILYHLPFSENKTDFICGLLRGGCANLTPMARRSFREMVHQFIKKKEKSISRLNFN